MTRELGVSQGWQVRGWPPVFFIHRVPECMVLMQVPKAELVGRVHVFENLITGQHQS